jgi:hypothetical protein
MAYDPARRTERKYDQQSDVTHQHQQHRGPQRPLSGYNFFYRAFCQQRLLDAAAVTVGHDDESKLLGSGLRALTTAVAKAWKVCALALQMLIPCY